MNDRQADRIERMYHDIVIIDSKAKGLKYLFDGCKKRFAIAGRKGMVLLTKDQARALKDELDEILNIMDCITERSL